MALRYQWHSTPPPPSSSPSAGADAGADAGPRCTFRQFDRTRFCAALGRQRSGSGSGSGRGRGRSIVLVGDSMQLQLHDALLSHLVAPATRHLAGDLGDGRKPCEGHWLCQDLGQGQQGGEGHGGVHLRAVRNDMLRPDAGSSMHTNRRWVRRLRQWGADILVLNRGAHFRPNAKVGRAMRHVLAMLRRMYPELLIIWRNTPAGHPGCSTHKGPLREPLEPRAVHFPYNWDKFKAQNELMRGIAREYGVVYMDVEHATSLRPDGHFRHLDGSWDCFHYCAPGPVDHWVGLLYNVLEEIDQEGGP
eukprot:jgi/Mesen1/5774/ME000293S04929